MSSAISRHVCNVLKINRNLVYSLRSLQRVNLNKEQFNKNLCIVAKNPIKEDVASCKTIRNHCSVTNKSYLIKEDVASKSIRRNYCSVDKNILKCWNCDEKLKSYQVHCPSCNTIQELNEELNHFEILGIPNDFAIDTKSLNKTYRSLQWQFHPDKFALKSEVSIDSFGSNDWQILSTTFSESIFLTILDHKNHSVGLYF